MSQDEELLILANGNPEAWDDNLLVQTWDDALAEYKVCDILHRKSNVALIQKVEIP